MYEYLSKLNQNLVHCLGYTVGLSDVMSALAVRMLKGLGLGPVALALALGLKKLKYWRRLHHCYCRQLIILIVADTSQLNGCTSELYDSVYHQGTLFHTVIGFKNSPVQKHSYNSLISCRIINRRNTLYVSQLTWAAFFSIEFVVDTSSCCE